MARSAFIWPSFSPTSSDFASTDSADASTVGEGARGAAQEAALEKAHETIKEQARQEGYAAGLAQARAETRRLHQALRESLESLSATAAELPTDSAEAIAELALKVVGKLLLVELRTNPKVLEQLVAEALDVLNAELNDVQVSLNPEDVAMLVERDPSSKMGALHLKEDAGVPLGGISVSRGRQSVEFDPLGRLAAYRDEEVGDGAAGIGSE